MPPGWRPPRKSCPAGHARISVRRMPTLEHNALVEMFRENPELAPHFLALLFHVDVPPHASVVAVESSLDQLIPVEFRADLVLELRDANGVLVMAIVLEIGRASC